MKHEKEVDELFSFMKELLITSDIITEDNSEEILNEAISNMGLTRESLSSQMEEGLQNGTSVEKQVILVKAMVRPMLTESSIKDDEEALVSIQDIITDSFAKDRVITSEEYSKIEEALMYLHLNK